MELQGDPNSLTYAILGIVIIITGIYIFKSLFNTLLMEINWEKSLSVEELERLQVVSRVKRDMERRRQRKIQELKNKIKVLERDRQSLDDKIKQEKEIEKLENLKILVQKNWEEESRVRAERALHDKEMDLEALEKLYLDAKRQIVLLDVKDAKLQIKEKALQERDMRDAAIQVDNTPKRIKRKKKAQSKPSAPSIQSAIPIEPIKSISSERTEMIESSSEEDSQEERDLMLLASFSQKNSVVQVASRREISDKKQIHDLQKKIQELGDLHNEYSQKLLQSEKDLKLYKDTNRVLTESLEKAVKKDKSSEQIFALKCMYEAAELEYLGKIGNLKSINNDYKRCDAQLKDELKTLKASFSLLLRKNQDNLDYSKKVSDKVESLEVALSLSKEESRKLKAIHEEMNAENSTLKKSLIEAQRCLKELQSKFNSETLKLESDNMLLKSSLEHVMIELDQQRNDHYVNEQSADLEQLITEHEAEIRIWKSKVAELQSYLNSSNGKIQSLEGTLKSLDFDGHRHDKDKSIKILSRGSSCDTLNNLSEDEIQLNLYSIDQNLLTKAERIHAEERLSEYLIRNYISINKN